MPSPEGEPKGRDGVPEPPRWLLVGTPNSGKTSLVNALASSQLEVGNWLGTTRVPTVVPACSAEGTLSLVDLPGIYELALDAGPGAPVRSALQRDPGALIVNVVDASRLEHDLSLTLELSELERPMIVALNLVDALRPTGAAGRSGQALARALEAELGVPVVATRADRGLGTDALLAAAQRAKAAAAAVAYPIAIDASLRRLAAVGAGRWWALTALIGDDVASPSTAGAPAPAPSTAGTPARGTAATGSLAPNPGLPSSAASAVAHERTLLASAAVDPFLAVAGARHDRAHALARSVGVPSGDGRAATSRFDGLLLHPVLGPLLALAGLALTFHLTFAIADPWIAFLGTLQTVVGGWLATLPLPRLAASFVSDGLLAGVGTVVSFIPVLFVLYAVLGWLENAGVLIRVARLADRSMRLLGLPGRAVLPLMLGLGCNVPAVQAAQALPSRDRIRAVLAVPSVPCSARLPVFVLFASVFFGGGAALVVLALYLAGFAAAALSALLLGAVLPGGTAPEAVELPALRSPPLRLVLRLAWSRTAAFLRGAGGPILIAVAAVWALLHVAWPGGRSLFEVLARALSPLFAPLGLGDWRLVGALLTGVASKEVVLGSLAVSFLGQATTPPLGAAAGLERLGAALLEALRSTGTGVLGLPTAAAASPPPLAAALRTTLSTGASLAFMVFTLLYLPCVATLAAVRQALGRRWMLASAGLQLALAYLAALGVARLWP